MNDCVSRLAVLNLVDRISSTRELSDYDHWYESIRDGVCDLPAVVSDIIYCKDCSWKDNVYGMCYKWKVYTTSDWYCASAKHRGVV